MNLRVHVHVEALDELDEAAAWYEARRPGLGFEFAAEIERVIASIAERPLSFLEWLPEDPVRRALARRFPYAVFFDVEPERAVIMAIAHTSRRPGYWGTRTTLAAGTLKIEEAP